jgi:hypothetical protein
VRKSRLIAHRCWLGPSMWFTAGTGLTGEAVMTDWTEAGEYGPQACWAGDCFLPPFCVGRVPAAQGFSWRGDLHQAAPPRDRDAHERGDRLGPNKGSDLSRAKRAYVVDVICRWIEREMAGSSETRVDPGSPGA